MPARKAQSRVEALGVQELVDGLLEANATYAEIQRAVHAQTGETLSDSALSRYRQRWASLRARVADTQREVEALMAVLSAQPGADFKQAGLGLLWTKLIRRMAEADADFGRADMVELGHLLLRAIRAGQTTETLALQRERLELLKQQVQAAAEKVTETGRAHGLDEETLRTIREEIYGIAPA